MPIRAVNKREWIGCGRSVWGGRNNVGAGFGPWALPCSPHTLDIGCRACCFGVVGAAWMGRLRGRWPKGCPVFVFACTAQMVQRRGQGMPGGEFMRGLRGGLRDRYVVKAEAVECIRRQDAPASTRSADRATQGFDEHKSEPPGLPCPRRRAALRQHVAKPGHFKGSTSDSPSHTTRRRCCAARSSSRRLETHDFGEAPVTRPRTAAQRP